MRSSSWVAPGLHRGGAGQPLVSDVVVHADRLLDGEGECMDRLELARIADDDGVPRAPEGASRALRGGLTGLVDQQPAERLGSEMPEQA